jgi:hypothetical protein
LITHQNKNGKIRADSNFPAAAHQAQTGGDHLEMGDRLTIEIVDAPFDPPSVVRMRDSEAVTLAQKIEYFHRLKEELKDYL